MIGEYLKNRVLVQKIIVKNRVLVQKVGEIFG